MGRLMDFLSELKMNLFTGKSSWLPESQLPRKERIGAVLKYGAAALSISLIFYDEVLVFPVLMLGLPAYLRVCRSRYQKRRVWEFRLGFSEVIRSMSAALESGYSAENAVKEAYRDQLGTHEADEWIMCELEGVTRKLENNVPLEAAIRSMAEHADVPEIKEFADILSTAKRTGGDLVMVIRHTSGILEDRMELARSIRASIAEKKFEADIMKFVPAGILIYLRLASPGLLDGVYGNLEGVIFMTVMLGLYMFFVGMAEKMVGGQTD